MLGKCGGDLVGEMERRMMVLDGHAARLGHCCCGYAPAPFRPPG
jgi:hypothetical protein